MRVVCKNRFALTIDEARRKELLKENKKLAGVLTLFMVVVIARVFGV